MAVLGVRWIRGVPMKNPGHAFGVAGLIGIALATACGSSKDATTPETGLPDRDGSSPALGDSGGVAGDDAASSATGDAAAPIDAGPIVAPQPLSPDIVVDQFGYLPSSEKIAVLRSPQVGFDKAMTFTPGAKYALVDAHSGQKLLEAAPTSWNGGATDSSSGDKAWWFDFCPVTTPGDSFALDE